MEIRRMKSAISLILILSSLPSLAYAQDTLSNSATYEAKESEENLANQEADTSQETTKEPMSNQAIRDSVNHVFDTLLSDENLDLLRGLFSQSKEKAEEVINRSSTGLVTLTEAAKAELLGLLQSDDYNAFLEQAGTFFDNQGLSQEQLADEISALEKELSERLGKDIELPKESI